MPRPGHKPELLQELLWVQSSEHLVFRKKTGLNFARSKDFLKCWEFSPIHCPSILSGGNLPSCASCDDRSSTGWRQKSRHFLEPTSMKAIPVFSHGINIKWEGVSRHSSGFLPLEKHRFVTSIHQGSFNKSFLPWQFWTHGENLMALVFWCYW